MSESSSGASNGFGNLKNLISILHVDDDASILEISKQILLDMDTSFEIDQAFCVDEAFKKLSAGKYDIVVSDYEMPQKDGLQFLRELREAKNEIPFVLFTGKGREEVAIKALNLGATGYFNKQGNPETVYGELAHGIKLGVEHWKAKQELIERELKYQIFFNNSEVGMFRIRLDGSEFLDFNEKYLSILGLTPEELKGKPPVNFWADPHQRQELVSLLLAKGYVKDFECKMLNKQQGVRTCLTSAKLYPEQGNIEGSITDITERKKAEADLADSVAKYRALVENAEDAIMLTDLTGKQIYRNPAYYKSLGFEESELLGIDGFARVHPDDVPILKEKLRELLKTGSGSSEYRVKHRDESWRCRSAKSTVIYNSKHQPYAILLIIRDITDCKKAEELIKSSEFRFRSFYENSFDAVLLTKPDGTILSANPATCRMFGMNETEIKQTRRDGIAIMDEKLASALIDREKIGRALVEVNYKRKDGSTFVAETSFGTFIDSDGTLSHSTIIRDISERKKAEEALALSKATFEAYLEGCPISVFTADPDGKYLYVNDAAVKMLGYSKEELLSMTVNQIVPKDNTHSIRFNELKKNGHFSEDMKLRKKDGTIIYVSLFSRRLPDGRLFAFCEDITERKSAEAALIESEANYKNLINGMGESVWVIDFKGNFVDVNDAAVKSLGYSKEEVLSLGIKDIDNFLSLQQVKNLMDNESSARTQIFETEHTTKDKEKISVEISTSLITYHGKAAHLAIARDISERKKAEKELKMYSLAIQKTNDGIVIGDPSGNITYVNDALLEMSGYANVKDIVGKHVLEFIAERDHPRVIQSSLECLKTGQSYLGEFTGLRNDRSEFQIEVSTSLVTDEKGQAVGFVDVVRNISERKKAEETLAESERLYRTLVETSAEGIVIAKPEGTHIFVNNRLAQMFGYTIDELLSKSSFELMSKEEQQRQTLHMRNNLDNNRTQYREFEFCRKDGSVLWAACNASPLIDEAGNHLANISMFSDITERKKAEQKLRGEQKSVEAMNEKLRVVGSLTRHDVCNKLSAVNGYAYLLKKKHKDQPDILESLEKIEQAVTDSTKIFEFSKMYEKLGVEKLTYIEVGKAVDEATSLFKGLKFKIITTFMKSKCLRIRSLGKCSIIS